MTYRAKRILALVLLVVWMPLYVVAAVTLTGWIDRPGRRAAAEQIHRES